ncbi:hypothetical protein BJY52DRAFT_1196356 [Lactarius psammicola]|nr:hypothetical protein BJY52DRAFT_1196356 [Lactarius psammicola]
MSFHLWPTSVLGHPDLSSATPSTDPRFPQLWCSLAKSLTPPLRNPRCLSHVSDGDGIIILGHPDLSSATPSTDPCFPFGRHASANATTDPTQIASARAGAVCGSLIVISDVNGVSMFHVAAHHLSSHPSHTLQKTFIHTTAVACSVHVPPVYHH